MHPRRLLLSLSTLLTFTTLMVLACQSVTTPQAHPTTPPTANTANSSELATTFHTTMLPLLQEYCYQCHANGSHKGDLSLDAFKTFDDVAKNPKTWQNILDNIRKGEMPPPDAKAHPTLPQRDTMAAWIAGQLYQYDPKNPDPGRVTMHRLNRAEYNNTIRDLVGVNFQPADDFPSDDSGYGFDNIGNVLSLPPVLMEKYLAAANHILDDAIVSEPLKSKVRHFNANLMEMGFNADGDRGDGWMPLTGLEEDGVSTTLPVPAGDYIVRVQAFVRGAGMKLALMVDDSVATDWTVSATEQAPGTYEYRIGVSDGRHRFAVVNRRIRGGANELTMENGRIGKRQAGTTWVKWVEIEGPLPTSTRRYPASTLQASAGKLLSDGTRLLDKNGEASTTFSISKPGDALLRVQAYADQAGSEPTRMELRLNGQPLKTLNVLAPGQMIPIQGQRVFSRELLNPMPYVYELPVKLAAGTQKFSVAFTNDFADPSAQNPNLRKRNLYLNYLEVVNLAETQPLPAMPAPLAKNFTTQPTPTTKLAAAREILSNFTRRAWRRPVTPPELDGLMGLFQKADANGETFETSLKLPMKAVLISPAFLFRGEVQSSPNDPKSVHPINEFALASRLSYFLWSSTPDDELLALADKNELRKNLPAQVRRMLASPKSIALAENFAGQWLQFRNLQYVAPDQDQFPDYDPALRDSMRQETVLFFNAVLREDRSVLDFLNGDFTFVNQQLAALYGIQNVTGSDFQRVSLANTPRRGLLTQASVLTITSNPTRTSPVKRGKWVLENILGTPPPPPPPDVPDLKNDGHPDTGTLRQQMEQHRASPACASCHATMDPLGFGLEQFDGIGKFRTKEGEFPIDSSGILVSGEKFTGAVELSNLLASRKRDEFLHCLADKMLTYSLGRGTEYYDRPALDQITAGMKSNDLKFSSLILEIVNSLPFQQCRGEAAAK